MERTNPGLANREMERDESRDRWNAMRRGSTTSGAVGLCYVVVRMDRPGVGRNEHRPAQPHEQEHHQRSNDTGTESRGEKRNLKRGTETVDEALRRRPTEITHATIGAFAAI